MDSGRHGGGRNLSEEGTLCSPRRLGCRSECALPPKPPRQPSDRRRRGNVDQLSAPLASHTGMTPEIHNLSLSLVVETNSCFLWLSVCDNGSVLLYYQMTAYTRLQRALLRSLGCG